VGVVQGGGQATCPLGQVPGDEGALGAAADQGVAGDDEPVHRDRYLGEQDERGAAAAHAAIELDEAEGVVVADRGDQAALDRDGADRAAVGGEWLGAEGSAEAPAGDLAGEVAGDDVGVGDGDGAQGGAGGQRGLAAQVGGQDGGTVRAEHEQAAVAERGEGVDAGPGRGGGGARVVVSPRVQRCSAPVSSTLHRWLAVRCTAVMGRAPWVRVAVRLVVCRSQARIRPSSVPAITVRPSGLRASERRSGAGVPASREGASRGWPRRW
jgi:hypothetical protein